MSRRDPAVQADDPGRSEGAGIAAPVCMFVFNRPDTVAKVLDQVSAARPPKLFIVADGPRPGNAQDGPRCEESRRIAADVSWPCEVFTHFSDVNMGSVLRVSSGLDWLFTQVDSAILLEDDCVPTHSFFTFCEHLLQHYRDDERVMAIAGTSFVPQPVSPYSYYFSAYPDVWGWATWRRSWTMFNWDLPAWPELRETNWLEEVLGDPTSARFWRDEFDSLAADPHWDTTWLYSLWLHHGLGIVPTRNLVQNIGWGADATHTRNVENAMAFLPTTELDGEIRHPPGMIRDAAMDRQALALVHGVLSRDLKSRMKRAVSRLRSRR